MRNLLARILFAFMLAVPLLGQQQLNQALELARAGKYAKARRLLKNVPEPQSIGQRIAYYRLRAAVASGLHEQLAAVSEMETALALAPADGQLLLGTAAVELTAGKLDDALSHAQAAPESATRQALLGDIEDRLGNAAAAVEAYRAAAALVPDQERYPIALALEFIEHQRYQDAIAVLHSAGTRFPASPKIQTLVGIAQYGEGYRDEAIESLENAIALAPKAQAPYPALAKIVLESSAAPNERTRRCLCEWDSLVCDAVQLRVARASGDGMLEAEAIDGLERASKSNVVRRCELGRAYEWSNQLAKARTEMEACLKLDPSPSNHYRLGLLYQHLGLTKLAETEMAERKKLQARMSEETRMSLRALDGLGSSNQ